jgi:carbon storage regulator
MACIPSAILSTCDAVLIFTRRRDEAIIIGDGIEVRVLRAGRDGVKLGVTAPSSVVVHRREIYDLIRAENEWSARRPEELAAAVGRLRRRTRVEPS